MTERVPAGLRRALIDAMGGNGPFVVREIYAAFDAHELTAWVDAEEGSERRSAAASRIDAADWSNDKQRQAIIAVAEYVMAERAVQDGDQPRRESRLLRSAVDRANQQHVPQPPSSTSPATTATPDPVSGPDPRKVFVVHGRNAEAREAMFAFLRALNLEPLEWGALVRGTGKGSPHISEVLDHGFSIAGSFVVLLTPDDEGKLRDRYLVSSDGPSEREVTGQARQNVVFDGGMAFARSPDKVILVAMGNLRPMSDLAGHLEVRFTGSQEDRHTLAARLEAISAADLTLQGWLTAGDFPRFDDESSSSIHIGKEATGPQPVSSAQQATLWDVHRAAVDLEAMVDEVLHPRMEREDSVDPIHRVFMSKKYRARWSDIYRLRLRIADNELRAQIDGVEASKDSWMLEESYTGIHEDIDAFWQHEQGVRQIAARSGELVRHF